MAEADVEGEKALREWATAQKVTSKTVDLLIKDGFNSMEAVDLLDCDDLLQSKIPRGQQKLLLKALQKGPYLPNTSATAHGSGSEARPSGEGSGGRGESSDGRGESSDGRGEASGGRGDGSGGRGESTGGEAAARQQGRDLGTASDDVYAQLMTEHMRSLQADDGRRNAQATTGQRRQGDMAAAGGQSMPGPWQDPQIHLLSAATGKSACAHYDVVDFIGKETVEEEIVAGSHDGKHIVVKSGVKPKIETITLSQWSIANLVILYKLLGEGKLLDQGVIDYLSYTTKVYQLTQRYENVSVYLYDREYRKMQAAHNFRWGTDIPHLHTMQLTPRAPRNNTRVPPGNKSAHRVAPAGPVAADGRPICKMFNTHRGCGYTDCKFVHACSHKGCSQNHPAISHFPHQTSDHPR